MSEIIHSVYKNMPVVVGIINNNIEYLSIVRKTELSNIYLCKVDNLINNKGSAFVRYKKDETGHVTLKGIAAANLINRDDLDKSAVHQGDELLLQLEAEPIKMKKAKLSPFISVSGKYSILTLGKNGVGISSKLPDELRSIFSSSVKEYLKDNPDIFKRNELKETPFGVIIRTEAGKLQESDALNEIIKDIKENLEKLCSIINEAKTRTVYSCLYSNSSEDPEFHVENAKRYLQSISDEECIVKNDSGLFGIPSKIEKLTERKVWLKSGAFLIIEQLESFNAIDVNTGKAITGKNIIEKVNLEAADEIMRQIRLRNLTGSILIDFINQKNKDLDEKLCNHIKALCRRDIIHTEFIDITGLGIVELTRNKNGKTLKDIIDNSCSE